jgi:hypothetical protein
MAPALPTQPQESSGVVAGTHPHGGEFWNLPLRRDRFSSLGEKRASNSRVRQRECPIDIQTTDGIADTALMRGR